MRKSALEYCFLEYKTKYPNCFLLHHFLLAVASSRTHVYIAAKMVLLDNSREEPAATFSVRTYHTDNSGLPIP